MCRLFFSPESREPRPRQLGQEEVDPEALGRGRRWRRRRERGGGLGVGRLRPGPGDGEADRRRGGHRVGERLRAVLAGGGAAARAVGARRLGALGRDPAPPAAGARRRLRGVALRRLLAHGGRRPDGSVHRVTCSIPAPLRATRSARLLLLLLGNLLSTVPLLRSSSCWVRRHAQRLESQATKLQ